MSECWKELLQPQLAALEVEQAALIERLRGDVLTLRKAVVRARNDLREALSMNAGFTNEHGRKAYTKEALEKLVAALAAVPAAASVKDGRYVEIIDHGPVTPTQAEAVAEMLRELQEARPDWTTTLRRCEDAFQARPVWKYLDGNPASNDVPVISATLIQAALHDFIAEHVSAILRLLAEQMREGVDIDWRQRYEDEKLIVDRCWAALEISTYEQAGGKAIWEIISEQKAARAAAEQQRQRDVAQARREERERCLKAAVQCLYGSPSSRDNQNPEGWHLERDCTPIDAAMHDNGCRDVYKAIRALEEPKA